MTTRGRSESSTPPIAVRATIGCTALACLVYASTQLLRPRADALPSAAAILALGAVVVRGLLRRHRLAWQWGRLGGYVFGAWELAHGTWSAVERTVDWLSVRGILFGVLWLFSAVALGSSDAKAWFRVICPRCGRTGVSANLYYSEGRCRRCARSW
jgi:hypothetical protein